MCVSKCKGKIKSNPAVKSVSSSFLVGEGSIKCTCTFFTDQITIIIHLKKLLVRDGSFLPREEPLPPLRRERGREEISCLISTVNKGCIMLKNKEPSTILINYNNNNTQA